MFTDGPACVIAGSQEDMERYLSTEAPEFVEYQEIKKTRYNEIIRGIELGAEYQFDNLSFEKFKEEAKGESCFSRLKITEKQKEYPDRKFHNVVLERI